MLSRDRNLLALVFVVALCSMAYQLLVGAVATQLTGDSVTQFSVAVGVFLSALGLGAFLSRAVQDRLLYRLLWVEVLLGLVGGCSALLLHYVHAQGGELLPALVGVSLAIGLLSGFELPLVLRLVETPQELDRRVSLVLSADYVGGLGAALAFPLLLLPELGAIQAAFALGLLNLTVVWVVIFRFDLEISPGRSVALASAAATSLLLVGLACSDELQSWVESKAHPGRSIVSHQTRYQRLLLARGRADLRLYINGNLQFSSRDEHRYHEALVHPAMLAAARRERVLILGGGDGLAAREVLAYPEVRTVHLVDLDPAMLALFRDDPALSALNEKSLDDPRLTATARDAMAYLEDTPWRYDVIVVDLPDPNSLDLGKLYSRRFYALASRCLRSGGALVIQSTSPWYAPDAYWCIVSTVESASRPERPLSVHPYWVTVPTFGGDWGFTLALAAGAQLPLGQPPVRTRFLTAEVLAGLFAFPRDTKRQETAINRLDDQALVRYYWAAQDGQRGR
tara:strand:+ start:1087 stop:2616 length:1530 start_codon:yes stop_codon:yes gene_type:complete